MKQEDTTEATFPMITPSKLTLTLMGDNLLEGESKIKGWGNMVIQINCSE